MKLVCEGKYKINQLGYNMKTKEYVYFHNGKEVWRMKGDDGLLNYFNEVRAKNTYTEEEVLKKFPVYIRYSNSCFEFEKKERKW